MSDKKIEILISLGTPEPTPEKSKPKKLPEVPIEERVREALQCIDSGKASHVEWIMINKLYKSICGMRKPSSRALNIANMIEPVLEKFGFFGTVSDEK